MKFEIKESVLVNIKTGETLNGVIIARFPKGEALHTNQEYIKIFGESYKIQKHAPITGFDRYLVQTEKRPYMLQEGEIYRKKK